MTYRERRLAKAERLRGWAEKREVKSDTAYQSAHTITDMIPAGQPILVGHHSERRHRNALERHDNLMRRSLDDSDKAEEMRSRADNIASAADNAIYSDDPDAIERLEAKVSQLEADREGIKAYNKSARTGKPDASLLTDEWRGKLQGYVNYTGSDQIPGFVLTNIGGNINRNKKRLQQLKRAIQREIV